MTTSQFERWWANGKRPGTMPGLISITFAAGCLCGPDRFAGLHSGNVAAHSLRVPFPWRGRPCRVVPRQHDVTLPHCREVQRLCCDRCLPCRLLGSALRAHQHAELQPVPQSHGMVWGAQPSCVPVKDSSFRSRCSFSGSPSGDGWLGPSYIPKILRALAFITFGRISSRISSLAKSASQRSGVITGQSEPNSILSCKIELM